MTTMDTQAFDATAHLRFDFTSGASVVCRWPSDAEFQEHCNSVQLLSKPGRKGDIVQRIGGVPADNALADAVRVNGSPITGNLARLIFERITATAVTESRRDGDVLTIGLRFLETQESLHRLRVPTASELTVMRAATRLMPAAKGFTRLSFDFEGLAKLYDQLQLSADGYQQSVPLVHKLKIMFTAIQLLAGRKG